MEAAISGDLAERSWEELLDAAEEAGASAAREARERGKDLAEQAGETEGAAGRRRQREVEEGARRSGRRARTQALDLGLALIAAWLRDLAAVGEGAEDVVLNIDESDALRRGAAELDPRRPRRGAELVMDTRRRLSVNVGEELALEALMFRLQSLLNP